jgi:hypothetical protein
VSSYDWLLFLHVLFATALVAGVVALVPHAAGRPETPLVARLTKAGSILAPVGGMGVLLLGLALVADRDYKFFSFWIIAAIVLWLVGTATGEKSVRVDDRRKGAVLHWTSAVALTLILVLMVWKPGE